MMKNWHQPFSSQTESSDQSVSAVYRQCWPHPTSTRSAPRTLRSKHGHECTQENPLSKAAPLEPRTRSVTGTEKWKFDHYRNNNERQQYHHGIMPSNLKIHFDQDTRQWDTWREFREDVNSDVNGVELFKMTQDTFRQLKKQVREVRMQMSRRNPGCGLKSYHFSGSCSKSALIHPSQLAANLPKHPTSFMCDGGHGDSYHTVVEQEHRWHRPQSHFVNRRRRRVFPPPRSKSSLSLSRCGPDSRGSSSPELLKPYATEVTLTPENLGPFEIVAKSYKQVITENLDSDGTKETDPSVKNLSISDKDLKSAPPELGEQEREYAPKVEHILENDVIDSQTLDDPNPEPDPIPNALSEPFCYMDLLELSGAADWRKAVRRVPSVRTEEMIMDRLIEMERLQQETSKLESVPPKMNQSVLVEKKGWNRDAAEPTERAQRNLNRRARSKNCSESCLQPACVGDCRPASVSYCRVASSRVCIHCHQRNCKGQCLGYYNYHMHVREPRVGVGEKERPKSCQSCVRKPKKTLDAVNKTNAILGRPRSVVSTFSSVQRGKVSGRKKVIPPNEDDDRDFLQRMKSLAITPPKNKILECTDSEVVTGMPRRRAKSATTVTGRDALLSEKSYQSQAKNSITTRASPTSPTQAKTPSLTARRKRRRRVKSAYR